MKNTVMSRKHAEGRKNLEISNIGIQVRPRFPRGVLSSSKSFQNLVQLVHVSEDIVGFALGRVHHGLICLTGQDQHGNGARVLRNRNVGIESVAHGTDLLIGDAGHLGDDVDHVAVGLADVIRLNAGGGGEQGADAAAVGQDLVMGHGADPVGICGDEGCAAAQEVAGPVQLFIHEFGIEALHHDVHGVNLGVAQLVVDEVHAVALEFQEESLRAGEVDARTGVALVEVHAGGHARGEDILPLTGKAQALTKEADPSQLQLRRGDKVYNINYLNAFKANLPLERIAIKPNDQIFVPALTETQKDQKAYVMGEVGRPGIVNIYNGNLTLAEALATAGGLQALSATARGIYVIRNTSEKQIDVYQLNSKNAMALAMADRFQLSSRDIVYVDASELATWNRLLNLITPSVNATKTTTDIIYNVQRVHNDGWK